MDFLYKKAFLDAFDALSNEEQFLVREADHRIRGRYSGKPAPPGLGIKKLHQGPAGTVFEARAGLALRILWAESGTRVSFILLGTHDDVRRYLKRL